jgi:hypothetical protein
MESAMVPTKCPACGHEYQFLIEPRPRMQVAAKLVVFGGALVTVACIALAFCLPLPAGLREISVWTLLIYAVPVAAIPAVLTLVIASRFSPVIDLKCRNCQRIETVCVRGSGGK